MKNGEYDMKYLMLLVMSSTLLFGCSNMDNNIVKPNPETVVEIDVNEENELVDEPYTIINADQMTLNKRVNTPEGSERVTVDEASFSHYLRTLPLKEHNAKVRYYDGSIKENIGVYEAVVDMDIGTRNLQQCADAIIRLRGEYLFNNEDYEEIHFNLTNGFRVDYSKWIKGNRVMVEGNNTYWKNTAKASNTYADFRKYMTFVFTYAGTLSLEQELTPIAIENMKIGDVFIKGGSPGHAVIVVDMAKNLTSGETYYMLAQSYMPAQDIQILKNPSNSDISPWYVLDKDEELVRTPEWRFNKDNLKRFE